MRVCLCLAFVMTAPFLFAQIGDGPVVKSHMDQSEIDSGNLVLNDLLKHGRLLFTAKFNTFDGQSRPGSTGGGADREPGSAPRFIRTSAPDSNSCAGCHNDPAVGAAGDFVANVFVLAQVLDPVTESVSGEFSNSRNTLGMHGAGPIEALAVEMTNDLQHILADTKTLAMMNGMPVRKALNTKGVNFGWVTANADGTVDMSEVEGVSNDLIIKPFHQKGAVISLREFTNNAMNHHHGMQSTERFGADVDADQDGHMNELTVGDITATSIWQAALATPGQVIPNDPTYARAIIRGERTFSDVGCGDCHIPALKLNSRHFVEPNPYNPAGNIRSGEMADFTFDMTEEGFGTRLEKTADGGAIVRAFTDLKRHNLCDEDYNHYCNEEVVQGGIPTEEFLTRKLWDVGNTAPYGHVGDLTTITEAIHFHGGEARASRDAFFAMSQQNQDEVIEFLKSLQILPDGTTSLVIDEHGQAKSKRGGMVKNEGERVRKGAESTKSE